MVNEKQKIAYYSAIVAFILTGGKLIGGVLTGSLGLLSLGLFSGFNLITALSTFYLMRISDQPPDRKHNFGHGKAENLFIFITTTLLLLICLGLIVTAISFLAKHNFRSGFPAWIYIVLVTSVILDVLCSYVLIRSIKGDRRSDVFKFLFLHFSSDLWCSAIVFLGIVFTNIGLYFADCLATTITSIFVIIVFYKLYKHTIETLLDYAPAVEIALIENILNSITEINGYSDLKIRTSGSDTLVSFKLYLNPHMKINMARNLCDTIKKEIFHVVDRCDILIHFEPFNLKNRII